MCGIAGIVSHKDNDEIGSLLKRMLQTMEHRGPDSAGFVIGNNVKRKKKIQDLNLGNQRGRIAMGHTKLTTAEKTPNLQPLQSENKKLALLNNGKIYNYLDLSLELNGCCASSSDTDSEVILKFVKKNYNGNLLEAVKKILPMLDGGYAMAITDNKQVIIARDKIGVRHLYFCRTGKYTAFASEKNLLWKLQKKRQNITGCFRDMWRS